LNLYGIRGLPLQLMASYLSDRRQCVRVGQARSEYKTVNMGVPQGSILGPILFLIYINDLPYASDVMSTILFADDTTLSLSKVHYDELVDGVNGEMEKISDYMLRNRLSVNVDKTFAFFLLIDATILMIRCASNLTTISLKISLFVNIWDFQLTAN
jgi:hypothetical protein